MHYTVVFAVFAAIVSSTPAVLNGFPKSRVDAQASVRVLIADASLQELRPSKPHVRHRRTAKTAGKPHANTSPSDLSSAPSITVPPMKVPVLPPVDNPAASYLDLIDA